MRIVLIRVRVRPRYRAEVSTPQPTWVEHAGAALRAAGHRSGGARAAVIEVLGRQTCCLPAQAIFDELRAEGRAVGIASVYRTLELLAELGLVQRFDVGEGVARYEPALPSGEHHHHLVCDRCGDVTPFEDGPLERAIEQLSGRVDFAIDAHDVTLRGECPACRGG